MPRKKLLKNGGNLSCQPNIYARLYELTQHNRYHYKDEMSASANVNCLEVEVEVEVEVICIHEWKSHIAL